MAAETPTPAVFTVTANGAPGLTREQTRSGAYVAPSRGVRFRADTDDPRSATTAAALAACRPGAVLCDLSAAAHWDLPLPPWIELADNPHDTSIAVDPGGAHPDRRGVRGRRLLLPHEHVTEHRGQRVTTPARTWLDCAPLIPVEHLIAMGDVVVRREGTGTEDLHRIVHWAYRRRGVLNARRALPLLDPAAESPGESLTRAHLVLNGVPRPECNRDIIVNGEWLARADLCWPDQKLIVEFDGRVHEDDLQRRRDARRRNLLQEAGWLVIVFTADDLRRPWLMASHVKRALRARTPVA